MIHARIDLLLRSQMEINKFTFKLLLLQVGDLCDIIHLQVINVKRIDKTVRKLSSHAHVCTDTR